MIFLSVFFFFFSFNLYFVVINLSLSIWRRETKNQVSNEEKKKHSHTHVWKKERVGLKLHGRYWCRRKVLNFSSKTSRGKGHLCHFQGNEWNYHFTLSLLVFPSNLRSHFSLTLPPLPPPQSDPESLWSDGQYSATWQARLFTSIPTIN